jgi:cytochrome c peroxidase
MKLTNSDTKKNKPPQKSLFAASSIGAGLLAATTLIWLPQAQAELPVGSFTATLRVMHSYKCLESNPGLLGLFSNSVQRTCVPKKAQSFEFTPVTGKTNVYKLKVLSTGQCLGIDTGLLGLFPNVEGARLLPQFCSSGLNQQFKAVDYNDGSFQLIAQQSNKAVQVASASTANGAEVQQWTGSTGNHQRWNFEYTSGTSLKGISVPSVPGLLSSDLSRSDIVTPVVVNKSAAIALGKALFWDQSVGSDGMACASCHFHAGGDFRIKNQINPGFTHNDFFFNATASGAPRSGPNYTLKKADFPFNPNNDDVTSSAGVLNRVFASADTTNPVDSCQPAADGTFNVGGVNVRKVEPRNTPTMINAAFNFRNFWDGRANNRFNGVSPFGPRDSAAGIFVYNGSMNKKPLNLKNSSLASQAVGPVLSELEMSCTQRKFPDVGRKVLARKPLANQSIHGQDSVLKDLGTLIGSNGTYADLVRKAFNSAYWNWSCSTCGTPASGAAYTQMEANFSMFFGLAVQLYEATLVSDDSKYDRWKSGSTSLTSTEKLGHDVFEGKGKCSSCHEGPVFSSAANLSINRQLVERMSMKNISTALYDLGFYNLGVVPTSYDIGLGGTDPWGKPLSFSAQYKSNSFVDSFVTNICRFEAPYSSSNNCSLSSSWASDPLAVAGSFKVPTLRNVALTGPYFHNGSASTLEQVVDFYNRGGNFNNQEKHPDIQPLGLSTSERAALVAFLKSLTDDRVAFEKAPFDHPSLIVPNGHTGNDWSVTPGNVIDQTAATDEYLTLPAVGSSGIATTLKEFHEILP